MDQELIAAMADVEGRHWWYVARRQIVITAVRRFTDSRPPAVLDVGCGTGGNLAALKEGLDVRRAVGIDSTPQCVSIASARGLDIVLGGASNLPFQDGEFDLVTALDVLEHVEDERSALLEMKRVLRRGGAIVLTVPAYQWLWGPHDDLNHHKRRYTLRRLTSALKDADLTVTYSSYFNTYLFPMAAAARIMERMAGRRGNEDVVPSAPVNDLLTRVFGAESRRIARGGSFPFGLSILAVARHKEDPI